MSSLFLEKLIVLGLIVVGAIFVVVYQVLRNNEKPSKGGKIINKTQQIIYIFIAVIPVFWDWFHLGRREWSKQGAKIKSLGDNPVRKDCNLYHLSFNNSRPAKPLRSILVSDSWLSDVPFLDIFALTLKSGDMLEAVPTDN